MLIYRLLLLTISPFVAIRMLLALANGAETRNGLSERMGFGRAPDIPHSGARLWIHGASLGELTSARAMTLRLLARNRDLHVIITANTYTGRDMVAGWNNPRISARLAPLDSPRIVRRFLANWRPVAAITLESEIWPLRSVACKQAGIPVFVIAGRMSKRSAGVWARMGNLSNTVMGAIAGLAPIDSENAARFEKLGLPAGKIGAPVNLKSDVFLESPDADNLAKLRQIFDYKNTVLAASTHAGEEEIILHAFQAARSIRPKLRLIMAPRHPRRGDAVAALIKRDGIEFSRRSHSGDPGHDEPVYLADTIGEMALWYSLCGVTILGGSFVQKGGHTPFEPVQFGSLVVHGPDVSNHAKAYDALAQGDSAFRADNGAQLTEILLDLADTPRHDEIAKTALDRLASFKSESGETGDLLAMLDKFTSGKLLAKPGD